MLAIAAIFATITVLIPGTLILMRKWGRWPAVWLKRVTGLSDLFGVSHLLKAIADAPTEMIRDLATDPVKRALFTKLAEHYKVLAAEVQRAINEQQARGSE